MNLCRGVACRLVVVGEVAQEEEGQHVVAEVVRIHGPPQLVGDAPEGVAELFLVLLGHGLQILDAIFAIAFVVIAHVDAFHIQLAVVDFIGQGIFEQVFDFQIFDDAALHR